MDICHRSPDLWPAPDEEHVAVGSEGKAAVMRGLPEVFGLDPLVVGSLHLGRLQGCPMRPVTVKKHLRREARHLCCEA